MVKLSFPATKLITWFKTHQRTLPWRQTSDPYAIWVSEIMLQQTQVKTVLPYYKKWMARFPTIESLAKAPLDEVIKQWEGLGYYSRARNLQKGAQEIVERFNGHLPSKTEDLLSIKGIGSYTKGAIQSFAFKMRSVLVDGNVKRVIARYLGLYLDFSIPKHHKELEILMETLLPSKTPWLFNEGLMELGALVCLPKTPNCISCPIQKNCYARQKKVQEDLPVKVKRKKRVILHRVVFVLHYKGQVLIQKNTEGIMKDLYEFPFIETQYESHNDIETQGVLSKFLKKAVVKAHHLPKVTHGFTHHHVTLYPFHVELKSPIKISNTHWIKSSDLSQKPFSSGHRKILKKMKIQLKD